MLNVLQNHTENNLVKTIVKIDKVSWLKKLLDDYFIFFTHFDILFDNDSNLIGGLSWQLSR